MEHLEVYTNCTVYHYRGHTFVHYPDGELVMVSPDYYEVDVYRTDLILNEDRTAIKHELTNAIIDFYDFTNRDMNKFPITEQEKQHIKAHFTDKEIGLWFPTVKAQYAHQKMMETPIGKLIYNEEKN